MPPRSGMPVITARDIDRPGGPSLGDPYRPAACLIGHDQERSGCIPWCTPRRAQKPLLPAGPPDRARAEKTMSRPGYGSPAIPEGQPGERAVSKGWRHMATPKPALPTEVPSRARLWPEAVLAGRPLCGHGHPMAVCSPRNCHLFRELSSGDGLATLLCRRSSPTSRTAFLPSPKQLAPPHKALVLTRPTLAGDRDHYSRAWALRCLQSVDLDVKEGR